MLSQCSRRYRTVQIRLGQQIRTVEDALPADLCEALAIINWPVGAPTWQEPGPRLCCKDRRYSMPVNRSATGNKDTEITKH